MLTTEGTLKMVEEDLSKKKKKKMVEEEVTATSLAEEQIVVEEIMSLLPTKKLQSLKTVCKAWLQLITSPYFVKLHLSKANRRSIRVLVWKVFRRGILEYNDYYKETKPLIFYPPPFSWFTRILGCVDGLIFLSDGGSGFITCVFNPSTRKCLVVQLSPPPPKDLAINFSWFGNLSGGEYVVIMGFFFEGPRYEILVYKFTPSSEIMNRICSTQINAPTGMHRMNFLQGIGTFVQGVVYWPVRFGMDRSGGYKIFTYHMGKNKHMEISAPAQFDFRLGLFVDGCSLFATFKNTSKNRLCMVELWIMKEDCWTKYANIEGSYNFGMFSPLGFFPNGDLVMHVLRIRLMKYSFSRKEATTLVEYEKIFDEAIMCVDGLVSPNC